MLASSKTTPKACTIGVCRCGSTMHTGTKATSSHSPSTCPSPHLVGQGVPSHSHFLITEASSIWGKGGHSEHLILELTKVTAQMEIEGGVMPNSWNSKWTGQTLHQNMPTHRISLMSLYCTGPSLPTHWRTSW